MSLSYWTKLGGRLDEEPDTKTAIDNSIIIAKMAVVFKISKLDLDSDFDNSAFFGCNPRLP
jgi:hypothetical protein